MPEQHVQQLELALDVDMLIVAPDPGFVSLAPPPQGCTRFGRELVSREILGNAPDRRRGTVASVDEPAHVGDRKR
jgi:hypothetical protein